MVQAVVKAGLDVEVIPGPSALTSAIMGAGIDTTRFAFLGFLPQKGGVRKKLILSSAEAELALVIYEAPQRVSALLSDLFEILGPRRVVVARELTKLFETFHRGELGQNLTPPFIEKGECVVVVEAGPLLDARKDSDQASDMAALIEQKIAEGLATKDVAKLLVSTFNMKKSLAYDLVIRTIKKGTGIPKSAQIKKSESTKKWL